METLVLMERAEKVVQSKCFYVRYDGKTEWRESLTGSWGCYYKFIVVDDILVIGPVIDHEVLYKLYLTRELPAEEAKERVKSINWSEVVSGPKVTLAGKVNKKGEVICWDSATFQPPFPSEEKARAISTLIAKLFRGGHLTPR